MVYAPVLTLEKIEADPFSDPAYLYKVVEEQSGIIIPDRVEYYHVWLIYETASRLNISIQIAFRLFKAESDFDSEALNPISNAIGYGQILHSTWLYMLVKNNLPLDLEMTPERNIVICLMYYDYLRTQWQKKGLKDELIDVYVLASYNAGIGEVLKYDGVPPYRETQNYISFIMHKKISMKIQLSL